MNGNTADTCRMCGFGGSDLQLGCGCKSHVRCAPLNLVVSDASSPSVNGEYIGIPKAVSPEQTCTCPFCQCVVGGIKILPLCVDNLEKAVELRKANAKKSASSTVNMNGKREREESQLAQVEAESSFLLLGGVTVGGGADRHHHRTGRWSSEEVQYVDFIIGAFDQGSLPIPHGVKLNDLLGEVLMCKSSRLTKKMKNAKLSTRSYSLKNTRTMDPHACATFSNLQERFLASVTSESSQLELRFNMQKLWRTHFSNLCLQVGYELLDAREWVSSLESMEGKASQVEGEIRKARRRRMSLALRTDVGEAAASGVFIGGMSARDANMQPPTTTSSSSQAKTSATSSTTVSSLAANNMQQQSNNANPRQEMKRECSEVSMSDSEKQQAATNNMEDDDEFLAALEMTASGEHHTGRSRLASEDMDFGILDEIDPLSMMPHLDVNHDMITSGNNNYCGPFLESIGAYMETNNVPFQYADVWVPSFMGDDGQATSSHNDPSKLRLFPAGHATRSDMDPTVRSQLNEFGSYSAHFSFAPGHGLPGRVYSTGVASWETRIHETDPSVFERAGGANVYGIKTAVGIPLVAHGIGRIVVALYSASDLNKDEAMLHKFVEDFKAWNPEPKWKLVIDLGSSPAKTDKQVMASAIPTQMVHYSHPPKPGEGDLKPAPVASTAATTAPQVSSNTTSKMIVHQHGPAKPTPTPTIAPKAAAAAAAAASSGNSDDDLEQAIASLLGDHMPSNDSAAASLLPHFMSLRLMLLRVRERRSPEENEKLDILKRSFVDYSKSRSGYELACLLAKDWMFLQPAFGLSESPQSNPTPPPPPQQQQSAALPMASQTNLAMPANLPVPLPAYSLPPAAADASASSTGMKMIVHQHGPPSGSTACAPMPRSRSVSASSEYSNSAAAANIVPEG